MLRTWRAYTILELVATLAVIGLLAAFSIPSMVSLIQRSQDMAVGLSLTQVARQAQLLAAFEPQTRGFSPENFVAAVGDTSSGSVGGTQAAENLQVAQGAASVTPGEPGVPSSRYNEVGVALSSTATRMGIVMKSSTGHCVYVVADVNGTTGWGVSHSSPETCLPTPALQLEPGESGPTRLDVNEDGAAQESQAPPTGPFQCPVMTMEAPLDYGGPLSAWLDTAGLPANYDWSSVSVSMTHSREGVVLDSDQDLYASASGWSERVLFSGGANGPAGGVVPGDTYEFAITGTGLQACTASLVAPAQEAPPVGFTSKLITLETSEASWEQQWVHADIALEDPTIYPRASDTRNFYIEIPAYIDGDYKGTDPGYASARSGVTWMITMTGKSADGAEVDLGTCSSGARLSSDTLGFGGSNSLVLTCGATWPDDSVTFKSLTLSFGDDKFLSAGTSTWLP